MILCIGVAAPKSYSHPTGLFEGYYHQRLPVQRSPEDAAGLSGDEQHGVDPEHPHAVGGRVGAGRRLQGLLSCLAIKLVPTLKL